MVVNNSLIDSVYDVVQNLVTPKFNSAVLDTVCHSVRQTLTERMRYGHPDHRFRNSSSF